VRDLPLERWLNVVYADVTKHMSGAQRAAFDAALEEEQPTAASRGDLLREARRRRTLSAAPVEPVDVDEQATVIALAAARELGVAVAELN
jgi:hypothetical protein